MESLKITGFIWLDEIVEKLAVSTGLNLMKWKSFSVWLRSFDSSRTGTVRAKTCTPHSARRRQDVISSRSSFAKQTIEFFQYPRET